MRQVKNQSFLSEYFLSVKPGAKTAGFCINGKKVYHKYLQRNLINF